MAQAQVKGFAVVLCLGILTSVFTAIFVSRGMVNFMYGNRKLNRVPIGQVWIPPKSTKANALYNPQVESLDLTKNKEENNMDLVAEDLRKEKPVSKIVKKPEVLADVEPEFKPDTVIEEQTNGVEAVSQEKPNDQNESKIKKTSNKPNTRAKNKRKASSSKKSRK